jgi:molybdopterin molybdotransferase
MLEYEEALARILAAMPPLRVERVPLASAHGRVLAERIVAPIDLPPFDNSAVDGYAVRSKDTAAASTESPRRLRLTGRVAAGESCFAEVADGSCVRIFTGSPLPPGADAVEMQEDAHTDPADPGQVRFTDGVKPWENVRFRGEDIKRGAVAGEPGEDLGAGRLSLLAALGFREVTVAVQPVTGILATGSELSEPTEPLKPGGIYESNRTALATLISRSGATPRVYPLVKDTPAETREALARAFAECDVVVTSGGVSVGEADYVKNAFAELGGRLDFWKVAMRPGRPFVFGELGGKFLFGLPGNPVSAFVSFVVLVGPALRRWQGAASPGPARHKAILSAPLSNPDSRRHFVRVRVDDAGMVASAGAQASHIQSSLARANGLVDVPPGATLAAGAAVDVLRWD